ncbi:MAG: hypothetical protein O7F71_15325 [Gammaproteobacteria bacterium]|nr:hypothetical protein [Gammaproteobacteria bacterium]
MSAVAASLPRTIARPFIWLALFVLAILATQSPITSVVLLGFVYARLHLRITGNAIVGLWAKIKFGVAGTLTLASLTLIPGILWTFAWHAGWDNSFNKGYEQAAVGPLTGVLGIVIFLLIMPYVQIAQASHMATGDWRAFYRIRENLKLWSGAPISAALLPVLYALAGLPLFLLFALPTFLPQMTNYADVTDAEVLGRLRAWYLLGGLLFVPLLFGIKRAVVWVYLRAVTATPRHTRLRLVICYPIVAALWFLVVAQLFGGQFINNHGAQGWLNLPLIQLPWVNRVPPGIVSG